MINVGYKIISKEQFSDLIKGHFNIIKPNDGDSYFVSGITGKPFELKLVWLVHHEGVYAFIDHNQI